MTRPLALYLLIALLPRTLGAQQSALPAETASPTTAPAGTASTAVLSDGTPVKLRLLNKLDSHTAREGDEIPFDVVNDVVVNGATVLRRGASVTGIVTQGKSSSRLGRAGRLSFTINDISLRNGTKVPVRAYNKTSGENRTGEMIGAMLSVPMAAAPFFLLMHGTNTTFPRGTEIMAFVNGDFRLDLANLGGTLAPTSTRQETK